MFNSRLYYRGLYSRIDRCNYSSLISKNAIQVDKLFIFYPLYFIFGQKNTLVSLLINLKKAVKKIFFYTIFSLSKIFYKKGNAKKHALF